MTILHAASPNSACRSTSRSVDSVDCGEADAPKFRDTADWFSMAARVAIRPESNWSTMSAFAACWPRIKLATSALNDLLPLNFRNASIVTSTGPMRRFGFTLMCSSTGRPSEHTFPLPGDVPATFRRCTKLAIFLNRDSCLKSPWLRAGTMRMAFRVAALNASVFC